MTKQDNSKPLAGAAHDTDAPSPALGPAPAVGPAAPSAVQEHAPPKETGSREWLVVLSVLIASAAVSVMCFAQIGLSLPVSAAAGAVTLSLLMLIHKQMQKSAQIAQLQAELAQTRQAARSKTAMRQPTAPVLGPSTAEARIRELSRDIGNLVPRSDAAPSGAHSAIPSAPISPMATELERAVRKPSRNRMMRSVSEPVAPPTAAAESTPAQPPVPAVEEPAAQTAPTEVVREQWSFRPRTESQVSVPESETASVDANGSPAPRISVAATVEGDLELVQRKIKELADEVNAAEALRPRTPRPAPRPKSESSVLEDSIGALRATAKTMRRPSLGDFIPKFETQAFALNPTPEQPSAPAPQAQGDGLGELVIPSTAERIAGSDPVPPPPAFSEREVAYPSLELPGFTAPAAPTLSPRTAALVRAIEDESMDVLLGPIVTLAAHSVSHYEMAVKLRGAAGEDLAAQEDEFALVGSEAETQFDIARFNRAAALAARMDARDREGSLLAEFFGTSLTSRTFLETFAHAYEARQRISAQLVLTFSQRAVDAFTPAAWQAIRDMHAFGFRLALDKVQHIGTDFAALQRAGFRFVRLDAQALIEGMPTPERFVPAEEIVQRATLAGLSIIANGIQDAAVQKRLLDAGIQLGQGPLFGASRQVNVDSGAGPAPDQSSAAA